MSIRSGTSLMNAVDTQKRTGKEKSYQQQQTPPIHTHRFQSCIQELFPSED